VILPNFVQSPLLRSVPGIYHAFLGIDPVPERGDAERLRSVFCVPPSRIGTLRQIHSATVRTWSEKDGGADGAGKRSGDALWTSLPGTGVGVRTADCVPVLIVDPGGPACAAVHAGWRGLSAGIVGEAVRRLAEAVGPSSPDRIIAAVGPSARGCCYEIGEEVADLLRPLPGGGRRLSRGRAPGKWMADLAALCLDALVSTGVATKNVDAAAPCTICSPRFHSYRREKALTGRQLSFIYITDFSPQPTFPRPQETA